MDSEKILKAILLEFKQNKQKTQSGQAVNPSSCQEEEDGKKEERNHAF